VQHDCEPRANANKFAIHLDVVAHARLRTEISADRAVDRDATGGN